jgi:hypothetical protein
MIGVFVSKFGCSQGLRQIGVVVRQLGIYPVIETDKNVCQTVGDVIVADGLRLI